MKAVDEREAKERNLFADFEAEDAAGGGAGDSDVERGGEEAEGMAGGSAVAYTRRALPSLSDLSGASGLRYLEYNATGTGQDIQDADEALRVDRNLALSSVAGAGSAVVGKKKLVFRKSGGAGAEAALERALE